MLWARRKIRAVKTTMKRNLRSPAKRTRFSSGSIVFQGVLIQTAFPGFGCRLPFQSAPPSSIAPEGSMSESSNMIIDPERLSAGIYLSFRAR
jgi:hypothetical protein